MAAHEDSDSSVSTSIWVEVVELRPDSVPVGAVANPALRRLGDGAEGVAGRGALEVLDSVAAIGSDDLKRGIASICQAVTGALESTSPDSCSVELNIGFKANAKVPVLMSGEANAALKVTLGWKKASDKSKD